MKIINLLGASLLMVSPYTFAESESELAFDSVEVTQNQNRGLATTGGAIKFASYAASSSQKIYSANTYNYGGAGCLTNSSASTIYHDESLNLPIGSIIVSVGYLYRDSGNGGSGLAIQEYDAQGSIDNLAIFNPAAVSGSSSQGSFLWLTTSATKSQVARFSILASPSASPCLVRVGYIPFDIADDVIFAHKFEY